MLSPCRLGNNYALFGRLPEDLADADADKQCDHQDAAWLISITEKGLREASHLIRYVVLDWTQPALLNLIMRRVLNNSILAKEFGIDSAAVLQDADQQEELFYRLFPKQVEQGPQKAATFKWLVTRCADGTGKTAPREMIHLLNCILEQEIKRLEQGGTPAPAAPNR